MVTNNYKVRLISVSSLISGLSTSDAAQVIFETTPTFSEQLSVDYNTMSPVHMPGGIQVYSRTNSRKFSIGAHLISRTSREATDNLMRLQILRSWTMPHFGSSSTLSKSQLSARVQRGNALTPTGQVESAIERAKNTDTGIELLGAPPELLYLYAYSSAVYAGDSSANRNVKHGVNINRVPVVLTSIDITYPEDVDYIPTLTNDMGTASPYTDKSEPFPVKLDVSISLMETHSPREYERFDLAAYKRGNLTNF